jgi:predicted membrane channel-forming protein YqfA (hemolysin III family)
MIFGLTLSSVYVGYHNWPTERAFIMATFLFMFVANFIVQMTPCYNNPKNSIYKLIFYCTILGIVAILAIACRFVYATSIEVQAFYGQVELSFVYLGVGFGFWKLHFPENKFGQERKWVQIFVASHFWWHVFAALNAYTMYWVCYSFNLHIEEYWDSEEPGIPMVY